VSSGNRRRNLAPAYQLALDLEAEGVQGTELAERLGVPAEALPSLLSVAHAKADAADLEAEVHPEGARDAGQRQNP
jgi:hypothetical protein